MRTFHERAGHALYVVARPFLLVTPGMNQPRARTLIYGDDKVLLTRSWFGRQRWSLPGGGIEGAERPVEAALRELQEEVGVHLEETAMQDLGTVLLAGAPWPQTLFACHVDPSSVRVSPRRGEILEAEWWPIDKLPSPLNPAVAEALRRSKLLSRG